MMRKLILGVFVTAVAALPLVARADWDDLKQRGSNLEQQGKELQKKGETAEAKGKAGVDAGKTVEQKTVTTYKKGRNYAKTTTTKLRKE